MSSEPFAILLVEDNPPDARLIREYLREAAPPGFTLTHADCLETARVCLERRPYDALLLDLRLPDGAGLEALTAAQTLAPGTPVVVLTGMGDDHLALEAVRRGAQDYLVKGEVTSGLLARSLRYAVERQRTALALRASEARYRLLAENVTDVIWTMDLDLRLTEISPSIFDLTGFGADEVIARPLAALLTPASLKTLEAFIAAELTPAHRARRGTGPFWSRTLELEHTRKDGTTIWAEVKIGLLRDEAGHLTGLVGVTRDSTDRRRVERDLRLAAQVFENAAEGIFVTDDRAVIVSANPACAIITGFAEVELVGRSLRRFMSAQHSVRFYSDLWRALRTSGAWQGEIWNRRKAGQAYPAWLSVSAIRNAQGAIVNYVGLLSDITARKELEARFYHWATHDALTGLPNRRLFADRLEEALHRARRSGRLVAVILLDLDDFKAINDAAGHAGGDQALQTVAERLRGCVRESDTVARLGGDEFTLILEGLAEFQDVASLARKILAALAQPLSHTGRSFSLGASLGISLFPFDGDTADLLVRRADEAMYRAKAQRAGFALSYGAEVVGYRASLSGPARRR